MTRIDAIKKFFKEDGPGSIKGREVNNRELMELTRTDKEAKNELGDLCLAALGETLTEK